MIMKNGLLTASRVIALGLIGAVAATGLAGVVNADAAEASRFASPKRCTQDGYGYVYKMSVSPDAACGTGYKVVDKWVNYGWLEDDSTHRIGRDGVLWKCSNYRESGKLNPYHVYCWSSQKKWPSARRWLVLTEVGVVHLPPTRTA